MLSKKLLHPQTSAEVISNHFEKFFQGPKSGLIGAEFEFPILSIDEKPWSSDIIRSLNEFITDDLCFQPILFADQEPIAFAHPVFKDKISYEVTHSTLEFSLDPKPSISELEVAFQSYFLPIQAFLLRRNLFLGCVGLHPFDYHQAHPVLRHPHYLNIHQYLRRCSKVNQDDFYRAPSVMIGSQTHVEVPFNQIYKYHNAYHSLGWVESKLMANSHHIYNNQAYHCFRDILLRNCGFGRNSENVSYPNQYFDSNHDLFLRFAQKSIFTTKIGSRCYHFEPIPLNQLPRIVAPAQSLPRFNISLADLDHCLAFNPVRITPYGTLEIRSACQQPFQDLFTPVAFQVAVCHSVDELLGIMPKSWAQQSERLRLHANLNHPMAYAKHELIPELLNIMVRSLAKRNYGEEKYLDVLFERHFSKSNPAKELAKTKSKQKSVTEYILEASLSN